MKMRLGPQQRPCLEVRDPCVGCVTSLVSDTLDVQFLQLLGEMPASTSLLCLLLPADHMALSCDVSKELEVQKTFETIQRTCGNITYLVNAAGINRCVVHVDINT